MRRICAAVAVAVGAMLLVSPYRTLPRLFLAPGLVLALCAGAALVAESKRDAPGPPGEAPLDHPTTPDAQDTAAEPALSGA